MSQRTGTKLLTADEQSQVRKLLGLPLPPEKPEVKDDRYAWRDAHQTQSERDTFAVELRTALKAFLDSKEVEIKKKENARRLDLKSLLPAAAAAKDIVNGYFADWIGNAALPAGVVDMRKKFSFTVDGEKPTIVSMADLPLRERLGRKTEPSNVVGYLMGTDTLRSIAGKHFFHHQNGTDEESDFYQKFVVTPFVAQHRDALARYEQYEMSMTDPTTARIFITPWVVDWKASETEIASLEVAQKKWDTFVLLLHEYIHVLEHPLLPVATGQSVVVREGFCEYLAVKVTNHVGRLPANELAKLNLAITGQTVHKPAQSWLPNYTAVADYKAYVKRVTDAMAIVAENAIYAAYFQGHTELLGTSVGFSGARYEVPPVTVASDGTRRLPFPVGSLPRGYRWLVNTTGIAQARFEELNRQIDLTPSEKQLLDGMELQISLPGYRAHLILRVAADAAETWEQIAQQNGTSVAEIMKLNDIVVGKPPIDDLLLEWVLVPDV